MFDPSKIDFSLELAEGVELIRATREAVARNAPKAETDQLLADAKAKTLARWKRSVAEDDASDNGSV